MSDKAQSPEALLQQLRHILQADVGDDLVRVAKDRMYWRERHAKDAQLHGSRSNQHWQAMKRYQAALLEIVAAQAQLKHAQEMANIARNALGTLKPDGTPLWP